MAAGTGIAKHALACATVAALAVTACGADREEPEGLGTETPAATDPAADPTGEATGNADATPGSDEDDVDPTAEPEASFTQPHLPTEEPSVIELDDELPVQPPGDVSDDEREVLEAAGRFMATWQAVLFGADAEHSRLYDTTTGVQLDRLTSLIDEMAEDEWVFVGEPMELEALSVSVGGGEAEADLCIGLPGWIEIRGGVGAPFGSVERYLISLWMEDGRWMVTDATSQDTAECDF
ncbi:hypothetical protein [Phytoactinopolyspora mesophila]|uniref:Nuclear transport factor 2 family protein n=1 Tax=Phytoactinopolyspora mesophila TaxID=2650750 RepID=A0A7K3M5G7_9ACTN|nr:hypothetical protein [Phytoactinopolyspora mesophila]NDL58553.1 hypothetical protein [Phytoactinopolyspora mesophila]